jgi:hypothetical protein
VHGARSLTALLRLALEPKVSQNRTRHRRERIFGVKRTQTSETLKLFVVSDF